MRALFEEGGKASFPPLSSDMASLTCFRWSHCSRTLDGNKWKSCARLGAESQRWHTTPLSNQNQNERKENASSIKSRTCEWRRVKTWVTKCGFVSVSRPHVTFHTTLLGHSSFICPSPPTFPSLLPRFSSYKRHPIIFCSFSSSQPEQRTQTKGLKKVRLIRCQPQLVHVCVGWGGGGVSWR